jgi:hypothetical protein
VRRRRRWHGDLDVAQENQFNSWFVCIVSELSIVIL